MKILISLLVAVSVFAVKVQGEDGDNSVPLGKVTCQATTMTVVFQKSDMEGNEPQIGEENCGAEIKEDNDTFTVIVPLDKCDTESKIDEDSNQISYMNKIVLSGISDSVITRIDSQIYPFGCIYDASGTAVTRGFSIPPRNVTYYEKDYGKFNFQMDFYEDSKFEDAYGDSDYPIKVKLSEEIFFKTSVSNAGKELSIFVKECAATPSMDPDHETRYVLIENGCTMDSTMKEYDTNTSSAKSYSFKSFRFTKHQNLDSIYVHCKLKVCHEDSEDSVCKDGCKKGNTRRRAITDYGSKPNGMSVGPVMVIGTVQSGFQNAAHSHTSLIIGCAAGAVALVALAIIGAIIYMKRH